ncbi:unnamed protein product [Calicophoron daubneyi]|uniref:Uncharacterized protein n=1 Tax=Calicophoron daubneyi TaxID=300641 RepID=A0AAV2T7Y1_CALDB
MQLTRLCLGRFIPWKRVPGSLWGGKQRKIPRLTHSRMAAFLDQMLLSQQNHRFLQRPCITSEVESATLEEERRREMEREDQIFYNRYAEQFCRRFGSRKVEDFWKSLMKTKRYDV